MLEEGQMWYLLVGGACVVGGGTDVVLTSERELVLLEEG